MCLPSPSSLNLANLVMRELGLTAIEAAQFRQAVGARAAFPARLEEIWDYCVNISSPIPGFHNQAIIDVDVWNAYSRYMVFAASYGTATPSTVRLAKEFLSERQLPLMLAGRWVPDPNIQPGTDNLVLDRDVICAQSRRSVGRNPPFTIVNPDARQLADRNAYLLSGGPRYQPGPIPPPALVQAVQPDGTSQAAADNSAQFLQPARRVQPARTNQPAARHPLATVSTPDDSPTPPRTRQGARQVGTEMRSEVNPQPAAALPGSTLAPTNSQRLVLKVQEEDGLAQVFRKSASSASDLKYPSEGSQPVAAPCGLNANAENVPSGSQRPGPRMGTFTRGLLDISPPSTITKIIDRNRDTTVTRSQGEVAAADCTHKRKASQANIRPEASKTPRMQDDPVPTTPLRGLVPHNVNTVESLHSEAKRSAAVGFSMSDVSILNTPTQERAATPPSPTFSAISENEHLPDYQALLEPVRHRLRVKTPSRKPQMIKLVVSKRSHDAAASSEKGEGGVYELVARAAGISPKK